MSTLGIWEFDILIGLSGVSRPSSATVTVLKESDGGVATIYEDEDGLTPLSNPFIAENASIKFYAVAEESYRIQVVAGGYTRTFENQSVSYQKEVLPLEIANGGTEAATAQAAINNLVGGVATSGYVLRSNGTNSLMSALQASDIPSLDASKVATGVFDLARIPHGAIEKMVPVADQAARFALTTATVQNGDTVFQEDTKVMYFVVDENNLGNAAGYQVYSAGTAAAVEWANVLSKPTTVSGYGITDAVTTSGDQNIGGVKNFTETIVGSINGQAGSVAAALTGGSYITSGGTYNGSTARTFAVDATANNTASKVVARDANGDFAARQVTFEGITVGTAVNKASLIYTTNTARNYTIPDAGANADFVMTQGTQTIAGKKEFSSTITGSISGTAAVATTVTCADESADTTCNVAFVTGETGNLGIKTGTNLTFNSATGVLSASGFLGTVNTAAQPKITSLGTLTTLTVDNININGNAITGLVAADININAYAGKAIDVEGIKFDGGQVWSRLSSNFVIGAAAGYPVVVEGVSFDGGVVTGVSSLGVTGTRVTTGFFTDLAVTNTITGSINGNAATATTAGSADSAGYAAAVTCVDESSDTTCYVAFVNSATGNLAVKTGSNLTFDSSIGRLTATSFAGSVAACNIGSTADLVIVTGASGVLKAKAAGSTGQFLAYNGAWDTPPDTNTTYTGDTGIVLTGTEFTHSSANGYKHIPADGAAGKILGYSSAGTAQWIDATSPAGNNGNIQFNSSGSFGGSSNLFWDNTNGRLGINEATPLAPLHIKTLGSGTTRTSNVITTLRTGTNGRDVCLQFSSPFTTCYIGTLSGDMYYKASATTNWHNFVGSAGIRLEASNSASIYGDIETKNISTSERYMRITPPAYGTTGGNVYYTGVEFYNATNNAITMNTIDSKGAIGYKCQIANRINAQEFLFNLWNNSSWATPLTLKRTEASPGIDNTYSCGSSSFRWTAVYATNGTIQTSDITTKRDVKKLTEDDRQKYSDAIMNTDLATFNFKNEVESKNKHVGFILNSDEYNTPEEFITDKENHEYHLSDIVFALMVTVQDLRKELEILKRSN